MPRVVVHFHKAFGPVFLVLAAGILLVGLALGDLLLLLLGGVNALVAWSFFNRVLCEVYDDRLEMKNALGMTAKTYRFEGLEQVSVDGNAVSIDGTGTLWNLSGRFADGSDWRAFARLCEADGGERDP